MAVLPGGRCAVMRNPTVHVERRAIAGPMIAVRIDRRSRQREHQRDAGDQQRPEIRHPGSISQTKKRRGPLHAARPRSSLLDPQPSILAPRSPILVASRKLCSNTGGTMQASEDVVSLARHVAVWIAAIAFFVLGALWYNVLSAQWLAAIGKTMEQMAAEQQGSPLPFAIGFAAILVMCYTLAWLIERLQATTFAGGLVLGAAIAVGFVSANLALNYGFESRGVSLWLINAVYVTVGLAVAGAIIGGWKRRAR
jgi:uncharacterized protein DUF1761